MIQMKKAGKVRSMLLVALFTALICIGAFIRIPIPVVPFTLQFLFTTLAGMLLGKRLGALSVLLYICLGLLGLPVFAQGGGIGYVLQPSFGYIPGFAVGAYLTGWIAEKGCSVKRLLAAAFAGLGVVYLLGMTYYYLMSNFYLGTGIGLWPLFLYCFLLAVPGDILLSVLCALLGRRLIPILQKER